MTQPEMMFVAVCMSGLSTIGSMLYFSFRVGQFKQLIEERFGDHERRLEEFKVNHGVYLAQVVALSRALGYVEGRVNGSIKPH